MDEYKKVRNFVLNCQKKSQKVVLTHGVFDLLHIGHLKTLNESKKFGDILIVGIDSDTLVKSIKGPTRPIIKDSERLEVAKNVRVVDMAFIMKPSTKEILNVHDFFLKLYRYLDIDVVTSGSPSEYSVNQKDICKDLGIEYHLAGKTVVETTSSIIQKIRDN